MCAHSHDTDSYAEGSVYQVTFLLDGGFLMHSTPMTGEEAHALMESFRGKYSSVSSHLLNPQEARRLLDADARSLLSQAEEIEDHLTYRHADFQKNADGYREQASNLLRRAEHLSEKH